MDRFIDLIHEYSGYILLGMGVVVILVILRFILNRQSHEEKDHQARLEKLKKKHADRYRDLRPLR